MDPQQELAAARTYLGERVACLAFEVEHEYAPSRIHATVTQVILAEKSYRIAWRNAHGMVTG
jgi:hypothetical protein